MKCHMNTRKHFFYLEGGQPLEPIAQRCCVVPMRGDTQNTTAPPRMLKGFIRDHFGQKRVLCLSGGRSTDVIVAVNIFLAQGSDTL
ncbi:hypothetical protein QYF61_026996 [Mycteria americana]|uniref:Uncharacterized protein n=1 Tax=Mycteria americana TaxID=33587 RepID=A0AAN7S449_MYCAM|nr:hypothetical protein QYF61_026996 [Mycteria americana]